jgi:hypothetical protein
MPTTQEIQAALKVLEEAGKHIPSIEDIKAGMSAQEIALILKAVRETGAIQQFAQGERISADPEPTVVTEHDKKVHAAFTRDTRYEPYTDEEKKLIAAEAVAAYRAAGVELKR